MKKLSIIILTYKSVDLLEKCINSIIKYNKNLDYEFIIINNDLEQKEKVENIFKNIKNTKILNPGYNTYFAGGINLGLKKASGDYVAFINDDGFFEDNSLEKMFDFIIKNSNEYIGVSGNIYNDNKEKTLTTTSTMMPTVLTEISRSTFIGKLYKIFNFFPKYYSDYQILGWDREKESKDVGSACDAFIILNKKEFVENGAFLNTLRLYYTEENIGQIAKKIGKKIRYLHDVKMIHNWNYASNKQPSSKILAITIIDRYIYFRKYFGVFKGFIVTFLSIIGNPYILFRFFGIIKWISILNKEKLILINNKK